MSTHPNAILVCHLTPDDLPMRTLRAIRVDCGLEPDDSDSQIKIGAVEYHIKVLEGYDQSWQIGGADGDIIVFDLVTYGYGERVAWDKLVARQAALAEWAAGICERHHCTAKFSVTANYW